MSFFFQLSGYTLGESPYDFDWRIGVVFSAGLLNYFGKFNISYWCVGLTLKANWQGRVIVMNQKDSNFTFKISSGLFTVEEKHNSVRYLITSAATWRKSHFKMSPSFTWFVYLLKFFFFISRWQWVHVGKCLVKFNKSLKAAGMSANNVRKLNIWPRTEASRATLNAYYFFKIF